VALVFFLNYFGAKKKSNRYADMLAFEKIKVEEVVQMP
jgi:hypothetical protein